MCSLWLPCFSIFGDTLFFFLMDAATDIGRASKENSSHFLDHLVLRVVYWFQSQETFRNTNCLIWTVNSRPPCWRNREIYALPAEEEGIVKFPLVQHSLWYDKQLFLMYILCILLKSSSGCLSLGICISSVVDGEMEKDYFHSGKELFFRAQTYLSVILSTQWFKAAVRWPEEPALVI